MDKEKVISRLEKLGGTTAISRQSIIARKDGRRTIAVGFNPDGECVSFAVILGYDNACQEDIRSYRDNLAQIIRAAGWNDGGIK